jgi:hypothetical protein
MDSWFKQFLLAVFPPRVAEAVYGIVIDIIVVFAKIGVFLSLPFKAVQFWIQSYRERCQKKRID